jgi:adhesin transport system membrane fusion protein
VVEGKISPADIAFVKVGQPAHVKLDAYDYSIFGAMEGRVVYISPDTLIEDTKNGPTSFYRVHVRISGNEYKGKTKEQVEIRPGMTAG